MELLNEDRIKNFDLGYLDTKRAKMPDGASIYFEEYGQGEPLVIVNNFFLIAPLWKNFTRQLSQANRIITFDLRNQGGSSPANGKLEFDTFIEDLRCLLDHLGIEKTYLLGSSTSTLICRDFAIKYPERVKGLILVSPLFCPYGSRRRKYLTKSWLNTLEAGGAAMLFNHIFPLVYSDRTIENGGTPAYLALRERFLALNSTEQLRVFLNSSLTTDDDPKKLKMIQCPTLLVSGEADFLMCRSSMEAAAKLVADSSMRIIDFAGHVPYFEATSKFEALVGEFLQDAGGANNVRNLV